MSYDDSGVRKIKILIDGELDPEKYKNAETIEIKKGLRLQPMKHMRREQVIRIERLPYETENSEIVDVLKKFGKVLDEPKRLNIEVNKKELDEWTSELLKIESTTRSVRMEIERNIPSFILVGGKRGKVWYRGQNWSCPRCLQDHEKCLGKGNPGKCQEKGGERTEITELWEGVINDKFKRSLMEEGEEFRTNTIALFKAPALATHSDVMDFIRLYAKIM